MQEVNALSHQSGTTLTAESVATHCVLDVDALTICTARGDKILVENISFDVRAGETVCIIGESGSGKSVTSLAVMGLLTQGGLHASAGSIALNGEQILHATPERLRALRASSVAMVFQEPMTALNPVQKVGAQIEEVLRLHTRLSAEERRQSVLSMLERVHLPDVPRIYSSYPHQLSGGQRQRIVIAMALILKPKLLIADEPTTALDVTTQKQILLLIKELQQEQNTAVVFITHDFGVVSEIADRIVVMKRGKLIETGTRDGILTAPTHSYTRKLISSVPSFLPRRNAPLDENAQKVLEVVGLDKVYEEKNFFSANRRVTAARNIAFSIAKGRVTGIVGESGSGKTTVARCVMQLIQATSGSVFVNGEDVLRPNSSIRKAMRRRVQYIFQDPYRSLNPRRTVGESIIEGLVNYGTPRQQALAAARKTLALVGLDEDALNRFPHQFSGGQRQRICIARAVVMEPDVLVADEAVSALDVTVQGQVLDLLEEIRERTGVAILFITHDLRVAAQICNDIIVMSRGEVVEYGPAKRVLQSPQHSYTRSLIDAAPARDWDFQAFGPVKN